MPTCITHMMLKNGMQILHDHDDSEQAHALQIFAVTAMCGIPKTTNPRQATNYANSSVLTLLSRCKAGVLIDIRPADSVDWRQPHNVFQECGLHRHNMLDFPAIHHRDDKVHKDLGDKLWLHHRLDVVLEHILLPDPVPVKEVASSRGRAILWVGVCSKLQRCYLSPTDPLLSTVPIVICSSRTHVHQEKACATVWACSILCTVRSRCLRLSHENKHAPSELYCSHIETVADLPTRH